MHIHVNGIELHWEEHGDGEPLLWLHGFMGVGADWRFLFDAPPDGCRLIAPDLRGQGSSTAPAGAYSFRESARDTLALLDHLRVERVKAIGLSGGGITALHMATIEPARIAAMVVVSAPPSFPEQARAIQRVFSESMLPEAERTRMRSRHRRPGQLDALFAQARAFAGSDDPNFTPAELASIAAETLIVFGDRDPFYPVSMAVDLYRAIPRSYLWVVPNGGHGPVFGQSAPSFGATALAFLRGSWR
ncbi:MAG: alpha/beta fold hydrolase [Betaproteobacteria bacterium]